MEITLINFPTHPMKKKTDVWHLNHHQSDHKHNKCTSWENYLHLLRPIIVFTGSCIMVWKIGHFLTEVKFLYIVRPTFGTVPLFSVWWCQSQESKCWKLILILLNKLHLPHLFLTVDQSDKSLLFVHINSRNWMTNSVDPDQMASEEAIWSGSNIVFKDNAYPGSAG